MKTYKELKEFARDRKHHIDEIEMELSFGGMSHWYTVAIIYSLDFGQFFIVSAHFLHEGTYYYVQPNLLEPFQVEIEKDLMGIDELDEERQAQREAYLDQRRTA